MHTVRSRVTAEGFFTSCTKSTVVGLDLMDVGRQFKDTFLQFFGSWFEFSPAHCFQWRTRSRYYPHIKAELSCGKPSCVHIQQDDEK